MNATTAIVLTPEERVDLLRFRDRLLAESRDRKEVLDGNISTGTKFTDIARDAGRILPILDRMLSSQRKEP